MTLFLNADSINKRSPYQVERIDDASFYFSTKEGLLYLVGFAPDYSFADQGVYQFYLVEKNHQHGRHDADIMKTAIAVIEEFFKTAPNVMLYVCDTSDNLHAVRNRLFIYWFKSYPHNSQYILTTEDVVIDKNKYYAGLMLSKSHPQLGEVIQNFHKFVQSLPDKFQ